MGLRGEIKLKFSVTELEGFKRCARLGEFTSFNGQGMGRLVSPVYFDSGTIWHASHAQWLLEPDRDFQEITWLNAQAHVNTVKQRYLDRLGFAISDSELAPVLEAIYILPFMAKNYQEVWHKPLPDGYECIAPEQSLVVPIPHECNGCICCDGIHKCYRATAFCSCDACHHELELTLDALIRNMDSGNLLIKEIKTYGSRPRLETLQNTNQFLRYIWGAKRANIGNVVGIGYDGAWKREGPTKKGMTLDELFLRTTLLRSPLEIENETVAIQHDVKRAYEIVTWAKNNAVDLEFYMHPEYFVPWNGCFDCSIRALCEAHRKGRDSLALFKSEYGPRQRNIGVAALEDV